MKLDTEEFELDKHQHEAISFLTDAITRKKKTVALLGAGGTGKSSILHYLTSEIALKGFNITFTATTNQAVNVIKEKIPEAMTLHKAVSKHVPTMMFAELEMFFKLHKSGELSEDYKFSNSIKKFFEEIKLKEENVFDYKDEKILIAEFGVDAYDERVFSHWATGEYCGGVCVIDESSMLPTESSYDREDKLKTIGLDKVNELYDTVVLVGDGDQLPPINGESSFEGIESFSLVVNHRSNKELLSILDDARNGKNPYSFVSGKSVRVVNYLDDSYYDRDTLLKKGIVHITYTNKNRKYITKKVRGEDGHPVNGERIVYRGASINDDDKDDIISKNEIGYYEDGFGIWEKHRQIIQSRHFDEYNEGFCYLRYGYGITAHMAQGSSFRYVIVHYDDVPHFIDKETKRKWLYTALSRAEKGIVLVI